MTTAISTQDLVTEFGQTAMPQYVKVSDTFRDDIYARNVRPPRVKKIVDQFDWSVFGRPLLSRRRSGAYAILDGNHRIAAIKEKFGADAEFPADVMTGLSIETEARIYTRMNTDRAQQTPAEIFKGDLAAKEPKALEIKAIVDERGLEIDDNRGGRTNNTIRAVATMIRIHDKGNLDETLDVLNAAWENEARKFGTPQLQALSQFLLDYSDCDRARLIQVLRRKSPEDLERSIKVTAKYGVGGNSNSTPGKQVLVAWYNERLTNPNRRLKL